MFDLDLLARYPQYVQLIGVGVVWISLHCAGMCGPIVIGLDLGGSLAFDEAGRDRAGSRRKKALHSLTHITAYQAGRSVTYAVFGALAGWGGALLQNLFQEVTKVAGLFVAGALLLFGILRLIGTARLDALFSAGSLGKILGRLARGARTFAGLRQKFLLGVILGFLPCMITFWALGLAASTQSPLHGAILMVVLVWLTSFVIYGFGVAPSFAPARLHRFRERLLSIFLVFSGIWLGIVSAAANEWIGHQSLSFTLGQRGFTIMFW